MFAHLESLSAMWMNGHEKLLFSLLPEKHV